MADRIDTSRELTPEDFEPIVNAVARGYKRRLPMTIEMSDIVQAGWVGALSALSRVDGRRNNQCVAYVKSRIRGAIQDELRRLDTLTQNQRTIQKQIKAVVSDLETELERASEDSEVAERMAITLDAYLKMKGDTMSPVRVPIETVNLSDLPAVFEYPEIMIDDQRFLGKLAEVLNMEGFLDERERIIVRRYWFDEVSMNEIGVELGCTESRICQLLKVVMAKLHKVFVDGKDPEIIGMLENTRLRCVINFLNRLNQANVPFRAVRDVMSVLSEEEAEMFRLVVLRGMSSEKASAKLGINRSVVRLNISRACRKIEEALEASGVINK